MGPRIVMRGPIWCTGITRRVARIRAALGILLLEKKSNAVGCDSIYSHGHIAVPLPAHLEVERSPDQRRGSLVDQHTRLSRSDHRGIASLSIRPPRRRS